MIRHDDPPLPPPLPTQVFTLGDAPAPETETDIDEPEQNRTKKKARIENKITSNVAGFGADGGQTAARNVAPLIQFRSEV